jgi:hypothetical protein
MNEGEWYKYTVYGAYKVKIKFNVQLDQLTECEN